MANEIKNIYILAAVNIQPRTEDDLKNEWEQYKHNHPTGKIKSYNDYLNFLRGLYQSKYNIDTYETAYFLDEETAVKYATANMADINECGSYPYIAVFSRQTNIMYSDAYPGNCRVFTYNNTTDGYDEITDIEQNEKAIYIRYHFDCTKRPKPED